MASLIEKGIGVALDLGTDIGTGSASISQAKDADEVVGEVIGLTSNVAVSAATSSTILGAAGASAATLSALGPIGLALGLTQALGSLLDALWNPFQTYYNKDLIEFKKMYNEALRKAWQNEGYNWPLEVKPPIMPMPDSPDEQDFLNLISDYYKKYGFISKEDVIEEENFIKDIQSFRRINHRFKILPDGNIDTRIPNFTFLPYNNQEEMDIMILLAKAIISKRRMQNKERFIQQIEPKNILIKFLETDWQLFVICLVSILTIIFSILIIISNNE